MMFLKCKKKYSEAVFLSGIKEEEPAPQKLSIE
jgi:hypothetical protein